jgi:hypothetical protein
LEPAPLAASALPDPAGTEAALSLLWPQTINANGMFIAAWRRRTASSRP